MDELNNTPYAGAGTTTTPNGTTSVKERAREMGDKLTQQVDRTRERTSSSLRSGSRRVEDLGERLADRIDQAREKTFNGLKSTSQGMDRLASYLENRDAQAMMDDTREMIRRHPGKSMIAGIVLGLMVGRLFSRTS